LQWSIYNDFLLILPVSFKADANSGAYKSNYKSFADTPLLGGLVKPLPLTVANDFNYEGADDDMEPPGRIVKEKDEAPTAQAKCHNFKPCCLDVYKASNYISPRLPAKIPVTFQ